MNWAPNTKIWAMMGNISKTAEPSVHIWHRHSCVQVSPYIRRGAPAPSFEEWAPNQNLAVQICHRSVGLGHPVACDACQALYSCKDKCCWQEELSSDSNAQIISDVTVVVHEDYKDYSNSSTDNDIAVVRLHTPLTFNDYVQPVCIPNTSVADGTVCVVTGWGSTQSTQIEFFLFWLNKKLHNRGIPMCCPVQAGNKRLTESLRTIA